jgi:integrase
MLEQGPRPDEVMSLQQAHVDLVNRHFTIWDSSAEGKSRNAHRKLKMTETTFSHPDTAPIPARRHWVFPSPKNKGPRTTLQKAHMNAIRGRKNTQGKWFKTRCEIETPQSQPPVSALSHSKEGGSGVDCRLYDMRHTFATRFALAGSPARLISGWSS